MNRTRDHGRRGQRRVRRAAYALAALALAAMTAAPLTLAAALAAAAAVLGSCTTTLAPRQAEPAPKQAASADDAAKRFAAAREQLAVRTPSTRTEKEALVLVHYMPWFQAPPVAEGYGFHWHMGGGVFDPFTTASDGKANIASHYYPLTGPYDTRDPAVLDYQIALMKLAGIDGVIFDWYGIEDALDYKQIHESTLAMVAALKRAGLKFAVCYEDQSIGKMVEAKAVSRDASLEAGKKVMAWMRDNWLGDEAYVKFDGRPLLLCFGPQFYVDPRLWKQLFEGIDPAPYFVTLDNHNEATADGSYNWPPMWASVGGKLGLSRLTDYLNEFYAEQNAKPLLVATAFPGFHDIYREGGAGASYGILEYADGETFAFTMEAALAANPDVIQIATWNDYGEGTIVEPTIERGFRELEYLQRVQKNFDPAFPYAPEDLRTALELYKLKTSNKDVAKVDAAYRALFAGNAGGYRAALAEAGVVPSLSAAAVLRSPASAADTAGVKATDPATALATGRRNLALGRPAVSSSNIYDFVATKAVDGEVRSYWEGGAGTYPNFLTVDLGSSQAIRGVAVKLNPARIWSPRKQTIAVLTSEDGENFTVAVPAAEYRFDPAANGNVAAIPLTATGRYVRLSFTANTEAKAGQAAEIEIYGEL